MAVSRVISSLVSLSSIRHKLAPASGSSWPQFFQHVIRTFTSRSSVQTSSKRKMQTYTAYQPHRMAPPISTKSIREIPNLTTSELISQIKELETPNKDDQYSTSIEMPQIEERSPDLNKEMPQSLIADENSSSSPKAKSRLSLRPRKAVIKLTPSAVKHLLTLLNQPSPKLIKVGVRNRGCSGLAYHLEYVEKAGNLDEKIEQDGVTIIIDNKALFSIIGSEMDWVEDKLSQRFVFKNPNISESPFDGVTGLETNI